ncbi:MAG: hypothetical protein ACXWUG_05430 [Polyangiales bacterium]
MRSLVLLCVLLSSCGDDASPPAKPPPGDPSPAWGAASGDGASQFAYGVALGPDLVVATGSFGGSIDFGSGRMSTGDGTTSGWISAFDRAGKPKWSRGLISTKDATAGAVVIGEHVFVGGRFSGTVTVGSTTATSAGNDDAFLLELGLDGSIVHLTTFGDGEYQSISSLAIDDRGLTIAGDFGGSMLGMTSAGGQDTFVARLEGGATKWTARFGGTSEDLKPRIALAGNDTVMAASYEGSFPVGTTSLPDRLDGMFMVRLDENGALRWTRSFPGEKWQYPTAVTIADDGRIAVGGRFAASFDSGATHVVSESGEDGFLCTFAPDGTPALAARFGGFGPDVISGLAFSHDDLFITGSFSTSFGPLKSVGANDIFVARVDRDLAIQWALRFGDVEEQHTTRIAVDDGSLAIVGAFFGDLDFGTRLRSNGGFEPEGGDAFVALFSR